MACCTHGLSCTNVYTWFVACPVCAHWNLWFSSGPMSGHVIHMVSCWLSCVLATFSVVGACIEVTFVLCFCFGQMRTWLPFVACLVFLLTTRVHTSLLQVNNVCLWHTCYCASGRACISKHDMQGFDTLCICACLVDLGRWALWCLILSQIRGICVWHVGQMRMLLDSIGCVSLVLSQVSSICIWRVGPMCMHGRHWIRLFCTAKSWATFAILCVWHVVQMRMFDWCWIRLAVWA